METGNRNAEALQQPVTKIKGVTAARHEQLRRIGIETVGDLLRHFPRYYEEFTGVKRIEQLKEGQIQTVKGEVVEITGKETNSGRQIVSIVLHDGSESCLEGVWFNQTWVAKRFHYGQQVAFTGKVKWYRDHWQMNMPQVQPVEDLPEESKNEILSVYPLTENLRADQIRTVMRRAVDGFAACLVERLPQGLREQRRLPPVQEAIRQIHFPATIPEGHTARRRFVYEELLLLQLALAVRRRDLRSRQRAPSLPVSPAIDARIRRLFPFRLTADQDAVIKEICDDIGGNRPMQRLLQADVGAGKTAVAVYALLVTVANQHQALLMAPTEVLARQHWRVIDGYLKHSRVRRLLLTGALSPKSRRIALAEIAAGQVDLVVGTQALIQEGVEFNKLGLAVIDEQHKFGVNQRARIRKLGVDPHYLVMTATPIPRTVALTVFGDLDVSIIKQLPPGRQPVATRWVTEVQRVTAYREIAQEIHTGRQMYVVCPLVAESETLDLKAAEKTYEELKKGAFKEFRLGLLHGRMDEKAKDAVMQKFRKHELDILVTTVVIEVGVDVPNATLLIVEHADRFGLSQLHQLRGRISRGQIAGQCYLFAGEVTEDSKQRLRMLTRTTDGFVLAEQDARLRGSGELFGARQHGLGDLEVADLAKDRDVLSQARKDAFQLVKDDAGLRQPEHQMLRHAVLQRYGQSLDLAAIG